MEMRKITWLDNKVLLNLKILKLAIINCQLKGYLLDQTVSEAPQKAGVSESYQASAKDPN